MEKYSMDELDIKFFYALGHKDEKSHFDPRQNAHIHPNKIFRPTNHTVDYIDR